MSGLTVWLTYHNSDPICLSETRFSVRLKRKFCVVWPPLHPSHSLPAHTSAVWYSVLWLLLAMTKHWAAPLAAATAGQVPRSTHSNASQRIPKAIVACAQTAWVPLPKEGTPLRNTSSCLWIQRASSLTLTRLTAGTPQHMKNRIIWSGRHSPDSCAK